MVDELKQSIRDNFGELRKKDPRPDPEIATGAMLKCILLLALLSRIRTVAEEIGCLLAEGFLEAAVARLRTMHEHVVIINLLMNDHTYEVCEQYHEHAVFERSIR